MEVGRLLRSAGRTIRIDELFRFILLLLVFNSLMRRLILELHKIYFEKEPICWYKIDSNIWYDFGSAFRFVLILLW